MFHERAKSCEVFSYPLRSSGLLRMKIRLENFSAAMISAQSAFFVSSGTFVRTDEQRTVTDGFRFCTAIPPVFLPFEIRISD